MSLPTNLLIVIIVASVVALVGLSLLLYFLLLRNKKLVRSIKELSRRYEHAHQLLTTDDLNRIKRLENISQVNLLFGDIHRDYAERYHMIEEEEDKLVNIKIGAIRDLINSNHYKSARNGLSGVKNLVNEFVNDVNDLNDDLIEISKPEAECERQKTLALEAFHRCVAVYEEHRDELLTLKNSYETVIKTIEKMFQEITDYIEQANYEDVHTLIPRVNKAIEELTKVNAVMPKLCRLATKTVPQKIGDLKLAYRRMLNDNCPVGHLISDQTISRFEDELVNIVNALRGFMYKHKETELNNIANKIDVLMKGFENEKVARSEFDAKYETVRYEISFVEKDFIKLCNSLPRIKQYYTIAEEKMQEVTNIQNLINKLGVAKRSFDNLLHNGSKTPYSVLLARINELNVECAEIKTALSNFRVYISSLKDDVEYAHQLVADYFYQLKRAEKMIHDAALDIFHEKYDTKIDEIYAALETISKATKNTPINTVKISDMVNFIRFDGDSVLNQINQDYEMMQLAESALTFSNRGRHQYEEINTIHKENEKLFVAGEFEKAYLGTKEKTIRRLMELNDEKRQ